MMQNIEIALLIYFLYGLTFFTMGLVLLLESWQTEANSPQKSLFLPLSIFGLLHGIHEWMEIFLLVEVRSGAQVPESLLWGRLGLLATSFLALALYSLRASLYARGHIHVLAIIGIATLPLFAVLVMTDVLRAYTLHSIPTFRMAESLVRYLIGVPAAAIATIGLRASALKARKDQRRPLDIYLNITALGFALYSLSQLFVPPMNSILASQVNSEIFHVWTSIPIQVFRTLAATIMTVGSFVAIRFRETERQQLVAAAQQARLEALEQQESLKRELLRHIVRAQEEERARIARELHDETAQILTAFSLDLATLQQLIGGKSKAGHLITRLQDLGKQMSQGIHRLVYDLRPAHLDELGLSSAMKFLAEYEGPRLKLSVDLHTKGQVRRLDPLVETILYRISQEALTNVARHAHTDTACICLSFQPCQVVLEVKDPGVGFDPSIRFDPPSGWGLAGMKERAESVGGEITIESAIGKGTAITVVIPLDED